MRKRIGIAAATLVAGCAAGGPMDRVLLKDYRPESSLVVPETRVPRAKFPVIETHVHAADTAPGDWLKVMDGANVESLVVLTGAAGPAFDALADRYRDGRFIVFCGIDLERPVAELERCRRKGARGVGLLADKGKGLNAADPRDLRIHVDDPRLDPFWRKCAELGMPVTIHIADHPSAWLPPDRFQERSPHLQRYSHYGEDIPSHEDLVSRFLATVKRHPGTTFVAVHLSNLGHDLGRLGRELDAHPNLYVDIAARAYELGRQPFTAHAFLTKYKGRVLFGLANPVSADIFEKGFRLLETRDEYMKGPSWWRLYGLGLGDETLEAIYRGNAIRLLR